MSTPSAKAKELGFTRGAIISSPKYGKGEIRGYNGGTNDNPILKVYFKDVDDEKNVKYVTLRGIELINGVEPKKSKIIKEDVKIEENNHEKIDNQDISLPKPIVISPNIEKKPLDDTHFSPVNYFQQGSGSKSSRRRKNSTPRSKRKSKSIETTDIYPDSPSSPTPIEYYNKEIQRNYIPVDTEKKEEPKMFGKHHLSTVKRGFNLKTWLTRMAILIILILIYVILVSKKLPIFYGTEN